MADQPAPVAVVTGSARGIGAAIVARLRADGFTVLGVDRPGLGAELDADLGRPADLDTIVPRLSAQVRAVDVLVHAAGVFPRADLTATTPELWAGVIAVNLTAPLLLTRATAPLLARSARGCVVMIGSLHADTGPPDLVAYAASKGGLMTLTRTLAAALAPQRIRVNAVVPGWVATEGELALRAAEGHSEQWLLEQGARVPLGRLQTVQDLAGMVAFLAGHDAQMITGQVIAVDGGMGLRPVR